MNAFVKKINVWNLLGIALILAFAAISAVGLLVNNDFWIDEAMLVQSVFTRTFAGIVSAPPDYSQTAPLGYLLILEIFSLILGNTEFAVRLPAALANFSVMFFAYRTAKDLIGSKVPLFYAGASLLCTVLAEYGTQAKQYSLEAMCFLLCVWVLGLFWRGRMKTVYVSLTFAVVAWFSFTSPLIMFSGIAVIIANRLIKAIKKQTELSAVIIELLPFAITLVSVIINLLVWVLPSSANVGAREHKYWDKIAFPLLPTSRDDLKLLYAMTKQMASPLGIVGLAAFCTSLAYALVLFDKKRNAKEVLLNKVMLSIYVTLAVGLIASHFGFLPMAGRVWVFVYPLLLIGIAYVAENLPGLFSDKAIRRAMVLLVCLACAADFSYFALRKNYIWNEQQLSASIKYVDSHKEDGDYIYVEGLAIPQYSYLTDYAVQFSYFPIHKNEIRGNVIFGARIYETVGSSPYQYISSVTEDTFNAGIAEITSHERVWLLFAHSTPDKEGQNASSQLLAELANYGSVTLENEYYATPVYLFVKD
jgi:hypothetical protein